MNGCSEFSVYCVCLYLAYYCLLNCFSFLCLDDIQVNIFGALFLLPNSYSQFLTEVWLLFIELRFSLQHIIEYHLSMDFQSISPHHSVPFFFTFNHSLLLNVVCGFKTLQVFNFVLGDNRRGLFVKVNLLLVMSMLWFCSVLLLIANICTPLAWG